MNLKQKLPEWLINGNKILGSNRPPIGTQIFGFPKLMVRIKIVKTNVTVDYYC